MFKEVLLTEPKIQEKLPSHSGDCALGEGQLYALPLMVKVKRHSTQHEHGTRDEVSYLIIYDGLLQNATDIITKCDSYFITKCDRSLLPHVSILLLQNATAITECDDFVTRCDSCYKMRRLLQIATVHSTNIYVIKKVYEAGETQCNKIHKKVILQ